MPNTYNRLKYQIFLLLQPRCEVCEKNNRIKTKNNNAAQLHLYHFLKISLSGFQRKQTAFLSKKLDKLSHDF